MQQLNVPLGENIWDCMRCVHAKFNKFRKHIGGDTELIIVFIL
jgi:hypothetical protein